MRNRLTTLSIAAVATVLSIVGCEKPPEDTGVPAPVQPGAASSSTSRTTGASGATTNPAAASSAETPAPSFLMIDGKQVPFPSTKLAVLKGVPGDFRVRLCTDDPPSAIDNGYSGNSFLFDMRLPIDSVDRIRTAQWIGNADNSDSDAGIFLGGYRNAYRPENVTVTFTGDPNDLSIYVQGTFSHTDPKDSFAPPQSVKVEGTVHVTQPGK